MKFIERSWYRTFGVTWLLLPLSLLFYCVAKYRFFRLRKLQARGDVPQVIVVGNIAVGGTGKTPFTLFLVDFLIQKKLKVAVISRGYGGEVQTTPLLVNDSIRAEICGDEPKLIAQRCGIPVVVCPNRNLSIDYLKQTFKPDVIIADDGLQHYQMERAIELCIVDNTRKHGNQLVLPAGPLREPVSRLQDVDLTIFNGGDNAVSYQLEIDGIYRVMDNQKIDTLTEDVTLVSAIGNPKRFEQSVKSTDVQVLEHVIFDDHHNFVKEDFEQIDGTVFMTEKDAV